MKLIESKAEYIPQEDGLEGIYKQIELAGRTCYKSEDKITKDSAKGFVERMIKSKHTAMLEHGTAYLKLPPCIGENEIPSSFIFLHNPYSKVSPSFDADYVTTNYRVLIENNLLNDLKYLCSPTEFHEKRYTMRFICSRGISHELVRARTMSFAQESQRYINYSKERHGGEITFIKPVWYTNYDETNWDVFRRGLHQIEEWYLKMLYNDYQPQQARDVLPNATKTELIMTGFASDWRFLMDLRLFEKTGKVAPDMLDLMQKAQKAMQEAGIWDDIMKYPSKFD